MFDPFKLFTGFALIIAGALTQNWFLVGSGVLTAIGAFAPAPTLGDMGRAFQANEVGTTNPINVVYGEGYTGGPVAWYGVDGPDNNSLWGIVCIGHGSQNGDGIEDVGDIYVDGVFAHHRNAPDMWPQGTPIFATETGQTGGGGYFSNIIAFAKYYGSTNQTVNPSLHSNFPNQWPTTSAGAGVAYILFRALGDNALSTGKLTGIPRITTDCKGVKIWDPRSAQWAWSDNPALCMLDYLTSRVYGCKVPYSEIDLQSFSDAAYYCDSLVDVPDGAGGTVQQKRFTCNGVLGTGQTMVQNILALETSCTGTLYYRAGLWSFHIRSDTQVATYALDETVLVGDVGWKVAGLVDDGANSAHATFFNPDRNWNPHTVSYPDPDGVNQYLIDDNYFEAPLAMDLPFTNDPYTALEIAKTRLLELREGDTFAVTAREESLDLTPGELITLDHDVIGTLAPLECWVVEMGVDEDGTNVLGLLRHNPAAYTPGTFPEVNPNPPQPPGTGQTTPGALTNFAVSEIDHGCAIMYAYTGGHLLVSLTVDAPTDVPYIEFEYRDEGNSTAWYPMGTTDPTASSPPGSTNPYQGDGTTGDPYMFLVGYTNGPKPNSSTFAVRARGIEAGGKNPGPWNEISSINLLTWRAGDTAKPTGTAITSGDITGSKWVGGVFYLAVDVGGTYATQIELHVSDTQGFTPSSTTVAATQTFGSGPGLPSYTTSWQIIPPVGNNVTFYYRFCVKDCWSDVYSESASCSGEFSENATGGSGQNFVCVDNGNSGASITIDWEAGWVQQVTLTAATVTISFSNVACGYALQLILKQDGSGSRVVNWPSAIDWSRSRPCRARRIRSTA
jgi:hypothetical protein